MVRRLKREAADLTFLNVTPRNSWPEQKFDVVSLIDVMHHVPPALQEEFLSRALARVKDGGIFLYKDMCPEPFWLAAANRLHDFVVTGERIHYFPVGSLEAALKRAGFQLEASHEVVRLWYGHQLRVFRAAAQGNGEELTNIGKRTHPE